MNMMVRKIAVVACLGLGLLAASHLAQAQYQLTNLVSNQLHDHATTTDPLLVNAWGIARSATSPFWVSDNLSGWSTLYTGAGTAEALRVLIPTAGNGPVEPTGNNGVGLPTGIVFNGSKTDFTVSGAASAFIFATLDGTISAWPGANRNLATLVVSSTTATPVPTAANKPSYTGLAITSNASGNMLYAADNANNQIDVFDGMFNFVKSFTDPAIPSTFSVFNVQDISGMLYVTYAATDGSAGGFVDIFNENGTFVKTLIQGFPLNQPWGVTMAPSNFGPLSSTLLVGNNSTPGAINAFNPMTGKFVGPLRDQFGFPILFVNLWGIEFGGGATNNGAANQLFVASGPGIGAQAQDGGSFQSIVFNPLPHHGY
jgi:uncharacterized protein (TIGR03118 family)